MAKKDIKDQNLSKIAVKNSFYNFLSLFILKFGGLIITILIARILLPEFFGIYSLALSIITIAIVFTDLGTDNTFLRYLSSSILKKNKSQARSYLRYLLKIKSSLVLLVILIVLFLSKYISYGIYNIPLLYYPLLFSCLYVIMESLKTFFATIFVADKNLKSVPLIDTIHQTFKIILAFLAIFLLQTQFKIAGLFVAFGIAGLIHLLLILYVTFKRNKDIFIGKGQPINKKRVWKYLWFMGIASISLVVFASVDTLMLGKFVSAEYLGYYRAALGLTISLSCFFSFSGMLLPFFTQIHKERFRRGFQKTLRYILLLSVPATVGIVFIAKYLIFAIYGKQYLLATSSLYVLAFLIITGPLIALYSIIFESKENTKIIAKSVLFALIINIILNVVLIKLLLPFGYEQTIMGVGASTTLSRIFLLIVLGIGAKSRLNLGFKGAGLRKIIPSTLIMAVFLFFFNKISNMTLLWGLLEVILAAGIYFLIMFLIKGINKEDFKLVKYLVKK